jgi:hypothetical protein
MRTGVCGINCLWDLGDHLGVWDICIVAGIGLGKGHCAIGLHVISGMLPGMLFLIQRECILFFNLRVRLAVGLGAIRMGGASVIRFRGGALEW